MAIFTKQEFQTIAYNKTRNKGITLNESRVFLKANQKQVFSYHILIMIENQSLKQKYFLRI